MKNPAECKKLYLGFFLSEREIISINKTFCKFPIFIYPPITKKWPPTTHILRTFKIHLNNHIFRAVISRLSQVFTLRSGNKTISPK